MDKMRDMQDTVKDMDSVVAEGIEEDDEGLDDLLADLDMDLAEEKTKDLPEAGKKPVASVTPVTPVVPVVELPPVVEPAIMDLNAELDSLSIVCFILHVQ